MQITEKGSFKERLSTNQGHSISFLILGIILLLNEIPIISLIAKQLGALIALFAIITFFQERKRKISILNANTTHYAYKSEGEKQIAKYLESKKISFLYEPEITLETKNNFVPFLWKKIILHPDFYLPEFDVYVEYWGMTNHEKYDEDRRKKQQVYKENYISLVELYPDNLKFLDWKFTLRLLEQLKERQGISRYR
ncbi:MAG: hypothetical protein Q7R96_00925 [Nanoarchaeota archaeon]|nr:hypothetical protein [Nanoarchaeota archaeon]